MLPPPELAGLLWWILGPDGRTPVPVGLEEGTAWVEANGTVRVALDGSGGAEVSTVFAPRLLEPGIEVALFETRVRRPGVRDRTEASLTWDDALAVHSAEAAAAGLSAGPTMR